MATTNFVHQEDFPLYATAIFDYHEEIDEETGETICYDGDQYLFNQLEERIEEFNRELEIYKIRPADGYYCGVQILLEDKHEYTTLTKDYTAEEWRKMRKEKKDYPGSYYYYEYERCYSEQKRAKAREMRKIIKFCETILHNEFDFEEYVCCGIFSNGEAVYDKASNKRARIKAIACGYAA